jgi:hypothetical protein
MNFRSFAPLIQRDGRDVDSVRPGQRSDGMPFALRDERSVGLRDEAVEVVPEPATRCAHLP